MTRDIRNIFYSNPQSSSNKGDVEQRRKYKNSKKDADALQKVNSFIKLVNGPKLTVSFPLAVISKGPIKELKIYIISYEKLLHGVKQRAVSHRPTRAKLVG